MLNHRLVIATHNRYWDFHRLLTHVRSYDVIFSNILVVVDGDSGYFEKINVLIERVCIGCSNYEVVHTNQIGGAAVRDYMVKDSLYKGYRFLSFLDDDDIPFKAKFVRAEKYLNNNETCIGYTCGYYRSYGGFGRRIISSDRRIFLQQCQKNNDIGGFSFVTLNLRKLSEVSSIPHFLKSNQDWYLWLSILKMHPNLYFWKEGSFVGLVYNDRRNDRKRLTLNSSNLQSTFKFYECVKESLDINLPSALDYFYYKHLKQKGVIELVRTVILNKSFYHLSTRHWRSILLNVCYNGIKRLFLSKTTI